MYAYSQKNNLIKINDLTMMKQKDGLMTNNYRETLRNETSNRTKMGLARHQPTVRVINEAEA